MTSKPKRKSKDDNVLKRTKECVKDVGKSQDSFAKSQNSSLCLPKSGNHSCLESASCSKTSPSNAASCNLKEVEDKNQIGRKKLTGETKDVHDEDQSENNLDEISKKNTFELQSDEKEMEVKSNGGISVQKAVAESIKIEESLPRENIATQATNLIISKEKPGDSREKETDGNKKEKTKSLGANSSELTREEGLSLCNHSDEMRKRAGTLFYQALADMLSGIDYGKAANLARRIETYLFETGKLKDAKLVRSKYLNLKNKTNNLAERIYSGDLAPERFVDMTIEEMKSDKLRAEEVEMAKKALCDATMPKLEAETDIFQCSRCKQRKCSYRQLQTRSADEPMTTFVKCVCGHAWKFS